MYEVKILADSIASGVRLTTHQVTYPRMVHSEVLTHRQFSRNSSSSRAIPIEKMLENVKRDPVMPVWWGRNQKGMQAEVEMTGAEKTEAQELWLNARDRAVASAEMLLSHGLHKQLVNRVVEPWMWITVIITATEWDNFFALRCNKDAQPEVRKIAEMMRDAMALSKPDELEPGAWHLPLVDEHEDEGIFHEEGFSTLVKLSVARCARVSYLTHEGKRDVPADLALYDRLLTSGHMSPFEHVARVVGTFEVKHGQSFGNFSHPWLQHRKQLPNEAVFASKT
jgi:thymidylate synthase ThyX